MNYGLIRGFLKPNTMTTFPKKDTEPYIIQFRIVYYIQSYEDKKVYKPNCLLCRIYGKEKVAAFLKENIVAGDELRIMYSLRTAFIKDRDEPFLRVIEYFKTGFNIRNAKMAIKNIEDERRVTWQHGLDGFEDIDTF